MFPNPWATPVPPPVVTKSAVYKSNTPTTYPYYATPTALQNMAMNPQSNLSLNATSVMNQSLQPNAIDPALVQKWQEWKQWEAWQQQFQQWQQQTGQITATPIQPAPPMPPSQPMQPIQTPIMPYQNQQYQPINQYNQSRPPLPLTNDLSQTILKNEVGMKRGLEPEFQNTEKKLKTDTATKKNEIELTDETEALFEEQFISWEEQFVKWKEQNKNHPDKVQYLEYEKKWLTWRDHLKQKCEMLKKKRELKMAEKKKETIQIEENKLHSQQRLGYNPLMQKTPTSINELPPITFQHLQNNNSSMVSSPSKNHIPGLDLVTNTECNTGGFLNVSKIIPQNQNEPIQTPDDKPFNFPKSNTTSAIINQQPVSIPLNSIHQSATSMFQNSYSWSKFNNPVSYYDKNPVDVNSSPASRFGQQNDINARPPYDEEISNTSYNSSQNATNNMNYRRPLEGSYINKPINESSSTMYNKGPDDQLYNRNFNTQTSNFRGYQANTSNNNNFNRSPENIPYQHQKLPLNLTHSKPPSLLSLNVVKPITLDKPGNYLENKNDLPNRYERNWNIADEEEDPENEYMEAHKKFSSEPFDDQYDEDQFSNQQHRNSYYDNDNYCRGHQGPRDYNDDYSRSLNQSSGPQMLRNIDIEYPRPNSQFSRNINQSYPHELQTPKNKDSDYYKSTNNIKSMDQGFSRGMPNLRDVNDEYSNESTVDKNKFISPKGNYGHPPKRNYEPSRSNFGNNLNKKNMEWDNKDYIQNEAPQQSVKDIIIPPPVKQPAIDCTPIDPVKIFDYRHLPTLKVIPGISKETVIPIRVYDYKHGGKRILPWQDRGFSRRNSNHPRDLNEKEDNINDQDKNKETLTKKPTSFRSQDNSLDIKDFVFNNEAKETTIIEETTIVEIKDDKFKEDTSIPVDTITIIDDDDIEEEDVMIIDNVEKEEILQSGNKTNTHVRVPSPPKMSQNKEVEKPPARKLLSIDTLLSPPGRLNRPAKIVIIMRGLPGSGKSYVAKLIKEKEVAMGGQAPRVLSLDDYFMTEVTKTDINPETNKKVEKKVMEYEYDSANESLYRTSFIKAFKKKVVENFFSFFIIDAINNKVTYYKDILDISRINGFTVYIIELEADVDLCIKRNIHNRTANDIKYLMKSWVKTPDNQILLDIRSLLNLASKNEMEMEDVSDVEMDLDRDEDDNAVDENIQKENTSIDFEEEDIMKLLSCKWIDTIPQEEKMKRLDGLCKKKPERSIKEWLQIPEDNYTDSEQEVVVKDGKKRVRWADMEERREQEKMRAIGFVVGQTDWNRMLGRDQGESKLTQTKYI